MIERTKAILLGALAVIFVASRFSSHIGPY